jgi:4-amino-4-deoxy-L-arabinose transferase-like glycosyltransferase
MNKLTASHNFSEVKFFLFLLFAIICLRFIALGACPLMDKTESRYAEIAREMLATNNWITPQTDPGIPFWAKPPLSIWATALSFKLFGVSETAARLPSLLFAIGNMIFLFLSAKNFRNNVFALKSCLVLLTVGLFYIMSGGVMTDPALSFSITLSMSAFLLAIEEKVSRHKLLWGYAFFLGIGLSLLSKGPVGVVLTLFPIIVWVSFQKKWAKAMRSFPWIGGTILMLAISLPWYIAAEIKTPGFLRYFFIGEHFMRFIYHAWSGDLYGSVHDFPRGMIWLFFILAALPWLGIFIFNIQYTVRKKKIIDCLFKDSWVSYFLLWFLSPLLFFTLAGNILITYVLPGLPAFAVLIVYLIEYNQALNVAAKVKWFTSFKVFIFFVCFMPFLFTVALFTIAPNEGLKKSHKIICKTFDKAKEDGSELIYLCQVPYSADFYSGGIANKMLNGFDENELLKYANDEKIDFYVVMNSDVDQIPAQVNKLISKIKVFAKYSLYADKSKFIKE